MFLKTLCSGLAGLAGGGRCCCRGPDAAALVVVAAVVVLTGVVAVAVGAAAVVALPADPGVVVPVLVLTEGAAVARHPAPAASLCRQSAAVPASLRRMQSLQ